MYYDPVIHPHGLPKRNEDTFSQKPETNVDRGFIHHGPQTENTQLSFN